MTRAIVLVGGFGTRLRPLTNDVPKQMLPIVNRPMIEHVLDHLGAHGVTEVILSLGYRPDAFQHAYPSGTYGAIKLTYAIEPEPLDTAGAIRFAARFAGVNERMIVCNGDVLTDLDISDLVARHVAAGALATIALHRVDDPSAFGVVPTDPDGKVQVFVEKPEPGTEPTNAINAGTYVLEPSVIDRIADGRKVSIERETFPNLVESGDLYAFVSDTYWIDTGTPANYLQAQMDLIDGRRGSALQSIDPTVAIGEATVQHSIIGSNVRIGAGASVIDSIIMSGATIGEEALVQGCIVGPGAIIGKKAVISDMTVLGAEAIVEPGERLAGARRPEVA